MFRFFSKKNVVIIGKFHHMHTKVAKSVIEGNKKYKLLRIIDVDECNSEILEGMINKKVKEIIIALDDRRGNFPIRFLFSIISF